MSGNSDKGAPRPSWLLTYLKDVCMGVADAMPDVSGGAIALVTSICEQLINAMAAIIPGRIKRTLGVVVLGRRTDTIATVREVDVGFPLAFGAGIIIAIVTVMCVLHVALNDAPVPTYGFFLGLIAASVVALYAQVPLDGPCQIAVAVAGFGLAFVALGGSGGAFRHLLPVIAVADGITASAITLPSVSRSFILLIFGQYEYMNTALNVFIDNLLDVVSGTSLSVVVEPGAVVATFMVGAVVGLFNIAHVVRWALEYYRRAALASLVSLIVDAPRTLMVENTAALVDVGRLWTTELYAASAVAAVVGAAAVPLADRHTDVIKS